MGRVIAAVALGAGFLHVFYRAVRFKWPGSYFTVEARLGYTITATPVRYTLFRFAPVFVTCIFVGVTLTRLHEDAIAGIAGVCGLHVISTSGLAIARLMQGRQNQDRAPLVILHVVVAVGIGLAGLAAGLLREPLASVVPRLKVLSASLWTGLFAAVLGAYLVYLSQARTSDVDKAIRQSRSRIPESLWSLAAQAALGTQTDEKLVRAIMLVENMQRPPWFRRLERLKGRIFKRGTYGIMQVESDRPISDEESVERAVRERLQGVTVPMSAIGYFDYEELARIATAYNPDANFVEGVQTAYSSLLSGSVK
jgi:hypothetical protein